MLAVMSLIFPYPMIGLAVDVGMLYVVKARLQGAVDGGSLAAARALNLGPDHRRPGHQRQTERSELVLCQLPRRQLVHQQYADGHERRPRPRL